MVHIEISAADADMKHSLDENEIGDEGAKWLASALQSPNCKVTYIEWVKF